MFIKFFVIGFILQNRNSYINKKWLQFTNKTTVIMEEMQIDNNTNILDLEEEDFFKKKGFHKNKFFNDGMDYHKNDTKYNEIILNITDYMYKQELLEKLQNKKISNLQKLEAINNYRKNKNVSEYLININAGKIMEEWYNS